MKLSSKLVRSLIPALTVLPLFLGIALKSNYICLGTTESFGPCSQALPLVAAVVLIPPILTAFFVRKTKQSGAIILLTTILWLVVWYKLLNGVDIGNLSLSKGVLYGAEGACVFFVACITSMLIFDRQNKQSKIK